jgi:hypothetical protein
MNITGLIFLIIAHFFTGIGILSVFNIKQKPIMRITLAIILGVMLASMVPMILQLCHVPITKTSVSISILVIALLSNITQLKKYNYSIPNFTKHKLNIKLYELVFIIVFIALLIPSVWRCYYFPPNARDVLAGPEPMAQYTVQEHTMINSLFSVNIESTNNHLKPPYIADLLIIYKLLVHPFGQTWLSVIVISFLIWFYSLLREQLHPVITGILMLFFICMPDPYGYTYIVLFDYSNMMLFFLGTYFLSCYLQSRQDNLFYFTCLLFGFATFIRFDTLVLIAMLLPMLWFFYKKEKVKISKALLHSSLLLIVPYLFYFIWVDIFIKYYMPISFDVSNEINHNLADVSVFFKRLHDMTIALFFSKLTLQLFGLMTYLFLTILITDLIFFRNFNMQARIMLYVILVVYLGLPLLGYLIPWFDLDNTTKRGFYKIFPPMVMYMRNSAFINRLSQQITAFEFGKTNTETRKSVYVKPINVNVDIRKKKK